MRSYRYYDFLMAGTVAVLLCSNLIGPAKACVVTLPWIGVVTFGAGNLFFPISYILGDVMTEVYGFARARRAIWAGFAAMGFATLMSAFILAMPASPDSDYNKVLQPALETVFGNTWRIVVASMLAFWVGDFVNSYVLAKMKIWTEGGTRARSSRRNKFSPSAGSSGSRRIAPRPRSRTTGSAPGGRSRLRGFTPTVAPRPRAKTRVCTSTRCCSTRSRSTESWTTGR